MNAHHNERQEERYRRDDPEGENRGKPFPWREVLIGILVAGLGGLGGTVFALGEKNSEFKNLKEETKTLEVNLQMHEVQNQNDQIRDQAWKKDMSDMVHEMHGWMKSEYQRRGNQ
jgi:hypothetical protein